MIDNSPGMEAKAARFRSQLPKIMETILLEQRGGVPGLDLHIGVVTSDDGAGKVGAPGCMPSPGGQRGRLQARGLAAPASCKQPMGSNFVAYRVRPDGKAVSNLPPGQTLIDTLGCMMSVGETGCEFEHPLESVYSALHDPVPGNEGFLRDEALLVVVFVTDEDDASAPPDTDVFDTSRTALYGFEDSYSRQSRFAVICGMPPRLPPYDDSGGPLDDCVPAPNSPSGNGPGKQFDVNRYIDLFTKPPAEGGLKRNPFSVSLIAIDGPETPFEVILSNPSTRSSHPYVPCPIIEEDLGHPCVPVLQHSCVDKAGESADPAVRLNTVVRAVHDSAIASICDDDYSSAFYKIFQYPITDGGGGCIFDSLAPDSDHPDCSVEDLQVNADGTWTTTEIPACARSPGTVPCWRMEKKDVCQGLSPDGVGITIDRGGERAPSHTTARIECAFTC